jgi:hypothetical protein
MSTIKELQSQGITFAFGRVRDGVREPDCRALELSCPAGQFFLDEARVGLNFGAG